MTESMNVLQLIKNNELTTLDPVRLESVQAKEIKKIAKRLGFRQRNLNMAFCRLHELNKRDKVAVMTVDTRL